MTKHPTYQEVMAAEARKNPPLEEPVCKAFNRQLTRLYEMGLTQKPFLWTHNDNGARSGNWLQRMRAGQRAKEMGTRPGALDYLFHFRDRSGRIRTVYLEFKRPGGTRTADQETFCETLDMLGIPWAVATTAADGIKLLQHWGAVEEGAA